MLNFIKNKFVFILIISAITLGVLVFGAVTLYKDDSLFFSSDGYIIETTTKSNKKHYFSANTEYKENIEEKIVFSDVDDKQVSIDPASFVHYSNGDVTFLKKGALVNLDEVNSSMLNYYNITNKSTIKYENGGYVVSSNDKKISIETFLGRISDNKYLISGAELNLKVPQNVELINGEYFEILFIEDGIVKIDNEKASYQVTAQDTYIYVGDDITIDLGTGRIIYDGEAKMLISQITINNEENINLDVDDKDNSSGGGGGGGGAGSGTGEGDGDGEAVGDGIGADGNGTGEGDGDGAGGAGGSGDGTGEGNGAGGAGGSGSGGAVDATLSVQVELIEAMVTSTTIDLTLQLNNASLAKGNLLYYFTNLSTGKREGNSQYIDLVNGTFYVSQESLSPSTDYSFTIVETGGDREKQYFQKTFTTKDLGITLEKVYASQDSLSYNLIFDENAEVTKARISIFDENGSNDKISNNQVIVSKEDINNGFVFEGLKPNTTYAVSVDMVWINNAAYSDVYSINRMDTTLKKTPEISGVTVSANSEEVKFDIGLKNVTDGEAIIKYIYNIYLADDITVDNMNPVPVYSVVKNDSDNLVLNLNEINELNTGVDYRCKIYAEYDDNEMIREVSTEYSSNFLIKSKPKISFEQKDATMNSVNGVLSLLDANCTVPMNGRVCANKANNFILRYYKTSEDEHNLNDKVIEFDSKTLSVDLAFTELESNTTYAVKLFGNYYDDDNVLHPNVQIGDTFFIKTDKSDNIYFEVVGNNKSGVDSDDIENSSIVTFDARLTAPQNSTVMEEISTITLNLYSGRYNVSDKLIGTYVIDDVNVINNFFTNLTITNKLFSDTTGRGLNKLNTLSKMIEVTNNLTGTLNNAYTVEVVDVMDSAGINEITVENNVYTFNLTPSYYLDTRIGDNPNENYLTVTPITKENLTEEEYDSLSKKVKNLDDLKNDTVVGLIVENSLSDIFVDSAFTYQNVVVDYIICNETNKNCDDITNKIVDISNKLNVKDDSEFKKELEKLKDKVKILSVDMGNKYQPKAQTIWLDSSELDDGDKYFTRGYKYKIGYNLNFKIGSELGDPNVTYTNDKLYVANKKNKVTSIERQKPIYSQYIYSSNNDGVTYKYKFSDVDNALYDKNFYYTLGEGVEYKSINNGLISDDEYHEVTIPFTNNTDYVLYYARRNTDDEVTYESVSKYMFEKEYVYDESEVYSIIDDNSNILKLKLENNDITSRAYAYKVILKSKGLDDYVRYFLASQLPVMYTDSYQVTPEGAPIYIENRYVAIDYANIIDFMNHDVEVEVICYYDSGKVGINQKFNNGFILKNYETGKYLNTYYYDNGSTSVPSSGVDEVSMGIYKFKDFDLGDDKMKIYNKLYYNNVKRDYNNIVDADSLEVNLDNHSVLYNIDYSSNGLSFSAAGNNYGTYDFRVVNAVNLKSSNDKFKFETIVPSISVSTDNTINSIKLNISTSNIYGNKQFTKGGKEHNKIYVKFYESLENLQNDTEELDLELATVTGNITFTSTGSGYTAKVDSINLDNLKPATDYYYTVSAYVNNELIRLFDSEYVKVNQYKAVDYVTNTLKVNEIIKSFKYLVKPTNYNGDYPENTLEWNLGLRNTKNYKVRFELYVPNGTSSSINPETGEEVVVPNYKAVNFNGTEASGCDITKYGDSSNGYVNGCYINVDKSKISSINNVNNKYIFTNNFENKQEGKENGFVYGEGYYKLILYAVPYTNGKYDEDNKLVLYEDDTLSNIVKGTSSGGIEYWVDVSELKEPTFSLDGGLSSGIDGNKYYISGSVVRNDFSYAIKNGRYTISLLNSDLKEINSISDITSVNKSFRFTGDSLNNPLEANSLYYIQIKYDEYRNNMSEVVDREGYYTTFIYTPVSNNITLGSITARNINDKSIILAYNGAVNLSSRIVKVSYTITVNGSNSKVSGNFHLDNNTNNIFSVASDKIPRLTIDVSNNKFSNNTGFVFEEKKTYIISTQYYYYDGSGNNELKLLESIDGKQTFTTMLNL